MANERKAPNAPSPWTRLGVERTFKGHHTTAALTLLQEVAMLVANPHARYVWRGQGDIQHTLHHSLHRRLVNANVEESEATLVRVEQRVLRRARTSGYDSALNRKLTDIELMALLQHEGAATRLLDVTPDPFIALFFACEQASSDTSAALIALLVQEDWPIRPGLGSGTELDIISQLDEQRRQMGWPSSPTYLVDTAFLNERMKAQRGQFVVGRLPKASAVAEWSSIDLALLSAPQERARIDRLINTQPGRFPAGGERPPLVVFRIRPTMRAALRRLLAERFGYTTETIYPDLNGFARAFDQFAPVAYKPAARRAEAWAASSRRSSSGESDERSTCSAVARR